MSLFAIVVMVVIAAVVFDYINGFHDAANAVATVVSTGVLPMRTAVIVAGVLNVGGALMGTAVAKTIGADLLDATQVTQTLVLSALLGAIAWNLITWYFGIPSSSSHALIGGLLGAGVAKAGLAVIKTEGVLKVVKALVLSPIIGFAAGFTVMILVLWIVRRGRVSVINRTFRRLQLVSAGFMAVSHGSNDAQKSMGVITMALVAYGALTKNAGGKFDVPLWVVLVCAAAMGLGTAAGGVRIIKTMGAKIIDLKPIHGFCAETSAAATILGASFLGVPVSTTHVISSCIMGVGASQRVSAVRWGVTTKIIWAWVLTIPLSALVAAGAYLATATVFGA
ncbi:MAG: inorganic phosphate transporter [Deltaproteobacteria bacterium RBG_16_71_12]|nr:MAG: inorganic phosphate transporter [Deltaproteobacteria bacterium RBG_16_71_12]